ncbi:MAG: hypothetical protein QHI48_01725, partial [Bacteroidota bacterium]|nr:hypothetical protein [Bacteroidota bacterium]
YDGTDVWTWMNHQRTMSIMQAWETAYIVTAHGTMDDVIEWETQGLPWSRVMARDARRGWTGAAIEMDHTWLGFLDTPNFRFSEFSFRRDVSFPAFTNFSLNLDRPGRLSYYNAALEWSCPWNDFAGGIVDEFYRYQVVLRVFDPAREGYETVPDTGTVDVTPRRLQSFRVFPHVSYEWQNRQLPNEEFVQGGTVTPDEHGLLTVRRFRVTKRGNRLIIRAPGDPVSRFEKMEDFGIGPVYPNPTLGMCVVPWALSSGNRLSLVVRDVLGRSRRTLLEGEDRPGIGSTVWDGRADDGSLLPAGVYFVCASTARGKWRAVKVVLSANR